MDRIEHLRRPKTLLNAHELPDYVVYRLILHGYRAPGNAYDAFLSLFEFHNQSVNVWTHLLGALFFVLRTPPVLASLWDDGASASETAFVLLFVACLQLQLLSSAMYHLFGYTSPDLDRLLLRLDISGIVAVLFAAFALGLQNGFDQHPHLKQLYLTAVCVPLLIAVLLTLSPHVHHSCIWNTRTAAFVSVFAIALVPITHWIELDEAGCSQVTLPSVVTTFAFALSGVIIYVTRFPESIKQHPFLDFVGQSHNWWHVCAFLASACWFESMLMYYDCRHKGVCVHTDMGR